MEQTRQTLEAQVLERAAKDPEFREQLKQDPQGTFSRDFGIPVPAGMTVNVLEETPTKVYLVLPHVPPQGVRELSAAELESVSGGWSEAGYTGCILTGVCGTCTPNHQC